MTTQKSDLTVETCTERYVVGTVGDYTMETRNQIPQQWADFFAVDFQIENVIQGAMFGVSFGMDADGGFQYGVGLEVSARPDTLPDKLCLITLSSGDYAVQRAFGPVTDLPTVFDEVYSKGIPAAGLGVREGAVFECYPDDPRNGPDGMAYEIWAPVTR